MEQPDSINQDDIDFAKSRVVKQDAPEKIEKTKEKQLYEHSVYETIVNTKDAYYSFADDLVNGGVDYPKFTIFTKNNRLFYLGFGLLIVAVILMIINSLSSTTESSPPHFVLKIDKS